MSFINVACRSLGYDGSSNNSGDDSGADKSFLTPDGSAIALASATNGHAANGNASSKPEKVESLRSNSKDFRKYRDGGDSSLKRMAKKNQRQRTYENPSFRRRNQKRDMKLLRTLVIILSLFVISTVPLGILFTISLTESDKTYVQPAKYLLTLTLFNSLINPWIYLWRFREMRGALRRLFCISATSPVCCPSLPASRISVFTSHASTRRHNSLSSSGAF